MARGFVRPSTECGRVGSSNVSSDPMNERYWVTSEECVDCREALGFYRYPNRVDHPEPVRCTKCSAKKWARQGNRPMA